MNGNLSVLAYAACGFLIVVFAWGRPRMTPSSLGLVLLFYLSLGGPIFAHAPGGTLRPAGAFVVNGKVAQLQLLTIGMTVWQLRRHTSLSRTASDP